MSAPSRWFPTAESRTTEYWTRSANDRAAVAQGCYFDAAEAERVALFFEKFLRHSVGQFKGKPFILARWQWERFIAPLFGWRRKDGTRRFRRFGIYVAKKAGKSYLMSALTIYLLIADREPDAEIYTAAADKDQAKLIYREASKMVAASPALKTAIKDRKSYAKLFSKRDNSFYAALSADVDTKDGINAYAVIFDELHTQAKRDLWRALRYAGRARRQPLFGWITTAGRDTSRLWHEELVYARKVQNDEEIDIAFLPVVYEIGENENYEDEALWVKANPSIGETFTLEAMREEFAEAKRKGPSALAEFRQLMLNQIVRGGKGWLSPQLWIAGDREELPPPEDGKVFGGLDLAATRDLNAFALCWWVDGGRRLCLKHWFWCPEEIGTQHERKNRDLYVNWAAQGHLKMTPGKTADYDIIFADIEKLVALHEVHSIAYDSWNAAALVKKLIEAHDDEFMQRFSQGIAHYNAPTKEFERLLYNEAILHPNCPPMEWMIGNAVVKPDGRGNVMPDKEASADKIDGVPAAIMALGLALHARPEEGSVYAGRGFFD